MSIYARLYGSDVVQYLWKSGNETEITNRPLACRISDHLIFIYITKKYKRQEHHPLYRGKLDEENKNS